MIDIFKKNQHAYDQIVLEFARFNHVPLEGNLLRLASRMVQYIGGGGRILDIGCGTGKDMMFFESQGRAVTGLDLSARMLAYAQHETHGGLAQMNMCRIGFPAEWFDGVWSIASLLHIPKAAAPDALSEFRRVIKPAGMLVVSVQEGKDERWMEAYVPGVKRFFAYYQIEELSGLLSQHGFSVLEASRSRENNRDWVSFICKAE